MSQLSSYLRCPVAGLAVVLAIPLTLARTSNNPDTSHIPACHAPACTRSSAPDRAALPVEHGWQLASGDGEDYIRLPSVEQEVDVDTGPGLCATAVSTVALKPQCTTPTRAPLSRMAVQRNDTGEVIAVMDVPDEGALRSEADALVRSVMPLHRDEDHPVLATRRVPAPSSVLKPVCHNGGARMESQAVEATVVNGIDTAHTAPLVLDGEQRMKMMLHSSTHHL